MTKYAQCYDCPDFFETKDLRPAKYESGVLVCENCYEQRMLDDEKEGD